MCRYGSSYKQTYGCFSCQKAFKKITFFDYLEQNNLLAVYQKLVWSNSKQEKVNQEKKWKTSLAKLEEQYQSQISRCPDCGGDMANLGMDFRVPKKSDNRAWQVTKGLYAIGAIFQTCGCSGLGYIPSSSNDYSEYLKDKLEEYQSRYMAIVKDKALNTFQREEQAIYWMRRIEKIKVAQQKT